MADLLERLQTSLASHYRIERELGAGGMAVVFLAEDLRHRRQVALKVLRPELAAEIGPERFLREIETAARLTHPHILPLHDSGEASGFLFYVMPYVEGESLRGRLTREKQLPLDDALQIAREVADALGYAHSHDVVHRDIKPENILLQSGHAVVADFGIARAITAAGGGTRTATGLALGTPAYMSPEQAAGSRDLDGRSDLYSLGCVLYEMLAGQPPFTGPSVESLVHQHLTVEPHPVTALRSAVPAPVSQALTKALAKTSADRFSTAAEFAAALAASGYKAALAPRRRSLASLALLAGVAALVGLVALGSMLWLRSRPPAVPRSLLVLPFKNLTGDPGLEYLCEGLAAEILSDLVRVPRLNVVSQTTAWSFRKSEKGITAIAKELGVHAILEGAIQRRGGMLRLDAQLVDGRNGFVTWTGRFERASEDVIRLEQEVVRDVARTVSGRPLPTEAPDLSRAPTRSPAAYDIYLQAGRLLDLTNDPMGPNRAAELYARALALDPEFALAHAGRSKALFRVYTRTKDPAVFRQAEEGSNRAIQLNPGLLEARLARAQMFRGAGRYAESIAELGEILNINPNWDEVYRHLASSYLEGGDLARAEASARSAIELRPAYWRNWNSLGAMLIRKGDYAGARAAFEEVVKLAPELNRGYENLASVATLEGKYQEAITAYERLPAPVKDGALASNIATAYFFARRLAEAEKFYLLAVQLEPRNDKWRQNLGDLYVRQGRPDPARSEYRQAARLLEEQLALNSEDRDVGIRLADCRAKAGDCEDAERSLAALVPRLPANDAQYAHSIARIHALCGRRAEAMAAVRRAIALGFSPTLMRDEDEFRSLASDSEFVRLMAGGSPSH